MCPADVIVVLDNSDAIDSNEFNQEKNFAVWLAENMDTSHGIGPYGFAMSVVTVRTTPTVEFQLGSHADLLSLQADVRNFRGIGGCGVLVAKISHTQKINGTKTVKRYLLGHRFGATFQKGMHCFSIVPFLSKRALFSKMVPQGHCFNTLFSLSAANIVQSPEVQNGLLVKVAYIRSPFADYC